MNARAAFTQALESAGARVKPVGDYSKVLFGESSHVKLATISWWNEEASSKHVGLAIADKELAASTPALIQLQESWPFEFRFRGAKNSGAHKWSVITDAPPQIQAAWARTYDQTVRSVSAAPAEEAPQPAAQKEDEFVALETAFQHAGAVVTSLKTHSKVHFPSEQPKSNAVILVRYNSAPSGPIGLAVTEACSLPLKQNLQAAGIAFSGPRAQTRYGEKRFQMSHFALEQTSGSQLKALAETVRRTVEPPHSASVGPSRPTVEKRAADTTDSTSAKRPRHGKQAWTHPRPLDAPLPQPPAPPPAAQKATRKRAAPSAPPPPAPLSLTSQPPDEFVCPISLELMDDPVCAADGHTYEKGAIEDWLGTRKRTSPKTGAPLKILELFPNHVLRRQIIEWREAHAAP